MVVGRMSYYSRVSSLERKEKQRGKEKSFSSWTFLIIRSGGGGKNVPFEPLSIILTRNGEEEKKTKLTRSGWNPLINWKGTTIECRYELAFWVKWATAAAGAALETKKKQNRLTYKMPRIRRVGRNKLLARRRPICTILLWEKRTRPKFFFGVAERKREKGQMPNRRVTGHEMWQHSFIIKFYKVGKERDCLEVIRTPFFFFHTTRWIAQKYGGQRGETLGGL